VSGWKVDLVLKDSCAHKVCSSDCLCSVI